MKTSATIISILLLFTTLTSSGCMYITGVEGNGDIKTETRDVSSFNEIRVGGAFEILLTQGGKETLKIEADENLLPLIQTKVKGGVLIITTKENIKNAKKLMLYINFNELKRLDISGACEISNEGTLIFSTLKFEASGASEINLDLKANKLLCDYSGASEINFKGKVREFELEVSGASDIEAYDLVAEDLVIDISGAGSAKIHATKSLKIEASGASSIRYMGNPTIDQRVSGAGSVRKR